MKPLLLCFGLLAGLGTAGAEIIVRWTFNSTWPDNSTSTGSFEPAVGVGYASAVGDITSSFATGDTAAGHDPAGSLDNTAWATSKYPTATNANKTAGVRFDASTAGYNQVIISWQQRNSATASRHLRLQYTLDGWNFNDGPVVSLGADSVFTSCSASLAHIAGAANNPLFAFRLVTEWQSTAAGSGFEGFVATTAGSDYSTGGTMRFDVVTVSGTLLPGGNNPPVISALPPQTVRVTQATAAVPFTVLDAEDPASALNLSAETSDAGVVPPGNVHFGGSGPNRTVSVTAGSQPGGANVLVRVTDQGGKSATTSFAVTVLPLNCEPIISSIPPTNMLANSVLTIPFGVGDLETSAENLVVSGVSSNQVLLPAAGLSFGGTGSNRWLTLKPSSGRAGVAPITLVVSDGAQTASATFPLMVRPTADVLFLDPFSYPDGSVVTNSAFLWANRSGIEGQTQVADGQVSLLLTQTEDLSATLAGGPYAVSNRTILYASFRVALPALPKKATGPFAHFGSGTSMVGRLYVSTTNAAPGFYRMLISNGGGTPVELVKDLETNTYWQVVMRYDVDNAVASFWINPRFDYDRDAWAADPITPTRISYFGLRQGTDIGGDMVVDDVRVGLSFQAVTSTNVPSAPLLLSAQRSGSQIVLRWASPASILQYGYSPKGPFYDSLATSPSSQTMTGLARFFRLK